jgi:hypothetical protein
MTIVDGGGGGAARGLIGRVQEIILRPTPTWEIIDGEAATVGGLYRGYVIPLAAIPAVCGFIGAVVFGWGMFGVHYRPPLIGSALWAIVSFALQLAGVYVLGLVIDALAPSFGGTKSPIQAFKVAAYSGTAAWLAGVFQLIPMIGFLGIVGLYSLFLLYKGLPRLMKAPQDKALGYTIVVIVCAAVVWIVIGAIASQVMRIGPGSVGPFGANDRGTVSGKVTLPGVGSVDVGKLEEASRKMQEAARTGKADLTPAEDLKGLLPGQAGGFTRGEVSTETASAGGYGSSQAKAEYSRGEAAARLSVADMAAAGAFAGMAGALSVESSKESGDSYEKVGKVGGRLTMEEYDRSSRRGKYGVLVGERFMVEAEGHDLSMDELKGLVNAVDKGRLERLAR